MPTEPERNYDPSKGRKFIFVTGGVMSGLGKGITAASTGRLLSNAGFEEIRIESDEASESFISEWDAERDVSEYVVSATIEAVKPA